MSHSVVLGPNQVCTLFGASSGSTTVPGRDYIKTGYDLNVDDLWRRNFIALVGFLILFSLTQTFVIELVPVSASVVFSECRSYYDYLCEQKYIGGGGVDFFAKDTTETKKLNAELKTRKIRKAEGEKQEKIRAMEGIKKKRDLYVSLVFELVNIHRRFDRDAFKDRKTFTWERVNYHVPVTGGSLQLLNNVYGYVKPGTLTALMGASGAGKTTCLDVLAQRKNIGVVSGDILIDGRALDADFARGTAYGWCLLSSSRR